MSAILTLASCKNPADSTNKAETSEKKAVQTSASGTTFTFTEGSTIGFVGSKVTGSHEGGFKTFSGSFTMDGSMPTSGSGSIDMNSTWSDNEKLTGHLKSADFFDVEKYPKTTFTATGFEKTSDSEYKLSMNVDFHGVSKNITFPTTVERDGDTISIKAEFHINRKDFNVNYPGMKDDLIRDEVVIKLDLKAKAETKKN